MASGTGTLRGVPEGGAAASALPHADEPTFDPAALEPLRQIEIASGRPLLSRLLSRFDADSAALVARIEAGIAGGDLEALRMAAHTLKSSSAQLGGRRLSACCRDLEALAREGVLDARTVGLARAIALERTECVAALRRADRQP